jgi:hypothetical protein
MEIANGTAPRHDFNDVGGQDRNSVLWSVVYLKTAPMSSIFFNDFIPLIQKSQPSSFKSSPLIFYPTERIGRVASAEDGSRGSTEQRLLDERRIIPVRIIWSHRCFPGGPVGAPDFCQSA